MARYGVAAERLYRLPEERHWAGDLPEMGLQLTSDDPNECHYKP
jgi:hypothetical protein